MSRWTDRRDVAVPALVGVVALLAAMVLGYLALRGSSGTDPVATDGVAADAGDPGGDRGTGEPGTEPEPGTGPDASAGSGATERVRTRRLTHPEGGFAVAVPRGLRVQRAGAVVRLTRPDRSLVVIVGPAETGSLAEAERRLLTRMRAEYRKLSVIGREPTRVDDRRARTVFGKAVNSSGVRLRYAVVTVHAGQRNFSIATYTAHDADPGDVLPQVNAVVNGFEVLKARP
jgi:hypothetical protein